MLVDAYLEQLSQTWSGQAVKTAPERCGDETRLRGLGLHPQGASNLVRVGGHCGPQALQARF